MVQGLKAMLGDAPDPFANAGRHLISKVRVER